MHLLFNLLRIKVLYIFRALLAHHQEVLHKRHLLYCVLNFYKFTATFRTHCIFCAISSYDYLKTPSNYYKYVDIATDYGLDD
jgi:hypothetical protein